jgi:hypothetical protein
MRIIEEEEKRLGRKLTESEKSGILQVALTSVATGIVGIGIVIGVLLVLFMIFKNVALMMWQFPLMIVATVLTLLALLVVWFWNGRFFVALIAAAAVGFLAFKAAGAIYDSGNRYYPSEYCADYVRQLPDGSMPKFTTKRDGRGDELPALEPGQWVRINGISYKEDQYNITTWNGTTGWVEGAAFPKDGAQWLFDRFGTGGAINREIAKDRQVERYARKFLTTESGNKMLPATRQRAIRVGAKTPYMALSREAFKETGDTTFVKSDMTVTLESIVYTDQCTMVHLSVNYTDKSHEYQSLYETFETLQVKDLDTGATFDVLPGSYSSLSWMDGSSRQADRENVIFMFWPFKSRHFSLTHAGHPQLDAHGGGWLGKLARVVSFGSPMEARYFTDWSFPEVTVR